ncbi:MAG: hypothetical protein AAFX99_17985, partial [Myxococcota bacterium]
MSSTTVDDPRVCRREQLEQTLAAALHRLGWSLSTPQWTAQQLLIYAPGGGLGHLTRAVNVARLLGPATIIHTSRWLGSVCPPDVNLVAVPAGQRTASALSALLDRLMGAVRMLIVDTFPGGLAGELTDAILERVGCRVMVQRYLKTEAYPDYHALIQRYTHIVGVGPKDVGVA